jgi:ankyrin repeat protein
MADVDVNAPDADGKTPLILAAAKGHSKITKLLLGVSRVDFYAKDKSDADALTTAARHAHNDVYTDLLQHKRTKGRDYTYNSWQKCTCDNFSFI